MQWRDLFIQILKDEFARQKARNSRLSMRQWSQKIGLSSGAISEIFAGHRRVSEKKTIEILGALHAPVAEINRVLALMGKPVSAKRIAPKKEDILLIKDWVSHAICGLYELKTEPINSDFISERLGIAKEEIKKKTQILLRHGLLQKSESGKIYRTKENWDLSLTLSPEEMLGFKEASLDIAKMALRDFDLTDGLFINYAFPGNPGQMEFIRQEMRKMFDSLAAIVDSEPRSELIQISVQLFPYRKKPTEKK